METLILMLDTAAILTVVVFSLRNEKRPSDSAEIGPFRIKPFRPAAPLVRAVATAARRRFRGL